MTGEAAGHAVANLLFFALLAFIIACVYTICSLVLDWLLGDVVYLKHTITHAVISGSAFAAGVSCTSWKPKL